MRRVILMKIALKMQIIHDPLIAKGTPLCSTCSSLQQGLPLPDLAVPAFQFKPNTAAHSDTGWEFGGSESCDGT